MNQQNPSFQEMVRTYIGRPPLNVATSLIQVQTKYIGLKELAHIESLYARHYDRRGDIKNALKHYQNAYDIDNENEYIGDAGVLYELTEHDYVKAKDWYEKGVKNGDSVSMFNLADLFDSCNDERLGNFRDRKQNAISLYKKRAYEGDYDCLTLFILRSWQLLNNIQYEVSKKEKLELELNILSGFELVVKYENIDICEGKEEGITSFYREYPGILQQASQDDVEEWNDLIDCKYNSVQLVIKSDKLLQEIEDDKKDEVRRIRSVFSVCDSYVIYKNKVSLFTKLNHVVDCTICFEKNVNIDLTCGHTFCIDCYPRLYRKCCPLCRMNCNMLD